MIQMLISPRNTLKDTPQLALKAGIECASEIPLLSLSSACPLPEEEIHTEWSSRDISPRSVILGLWPDSSDSEVRSIIFIHQITQITQIRSLRSLRGTQHYLYRSDHSVLMELSQITATLLAAWHLPPSSYFLTIKLTCTLISSLVIFHQEKFGIAVIIFGRFWHEQNCLFEGKKKNKKGAFMRILPCSSKRDRFIQHRALEVFLFFASVLSGLVNDGFFLPPTVWLDNII